MYEVKLKNSDEKVIIDEKVHDCRIENVEWRSRSTASRKRKSSSSAGYTGVYKENFRYRAVISKDHPTLLKKT